MGNGSRHKIGVYTLAMINVAAIASLKNLPMMAEYGFSLIFFYVLAAVVFFIPSALVSAELATGWPKTGGVYIWVREALGAKWGFVAIWLQWIENVIWYPTILSFAAATLAYIFDPALASNKFFMLAVILITYWGSTLMNLMGMRAAGLLSSIGVIGGTIIPGILIISLGAYWLISGQESQIAFTAHSLVPDMSNLNNLIFLTGVLLGLMGMEMSAVHAQEVKNPQKDYPKAILLSAVIILVVMILGSFSIAVVLPRTEISLVAGVMEAFDFFFKKYHLDWLTPILAALIVVGAIGTVSTWIIGPSKGLLATAQSGDLPKFFQKTNENGMPLRIMILQAVIVTVLALVFLVMPTVSMAYLILTALTTQLYLIMYGLMFISAIRLRYTKPGVKRAYRVPGGNIGMWVVSSVALVASAFTIVFGFLPPSELTTGRQVALYEMFLFMGVILMFLAPIAIHHFHRSRKEK